MEPPPVLIWPPFKPVLPAKARIPPAAPVVVPRVSTFTLGIVPTFWVPPPEFSVRLLRVVDTPIVP